MTKMGSKNKGVLVQYYTREDVYEMVHKLEDALEYVSNIVSDETRFPIDGYRADSEHNIIENSQSDIALKKAQYINYMKCSDYYHKIEEALRNAIGILDYDKPKILKDLKKRLDDIQYPILTNYWFIRYHLAIPSLVQTYVKSFSMVIKNSGTVTFRESIMSLICDALNNLDISSISFDYQTKQKMSRNLVKIARNNNFEFKNIDPDKYMFKILEQYIVARIDIDQIFRGLLSDNDSKFGSQGFGYEEFGSEYIEDFCSGDISRQKFNRLVNIYCKDLHYSMGDLLSEGKIFNDEDIDIYKKIPFDDIRFEDGYHNVCRVVLKNGKVYPQENMSFNNGDIIEICPCKEISGQSLYSREIRDLVFKIEDEAEPKYMMPLGYCQYYIIEDEYNKGNCDYMYDPNMKCIVIKATRPISPKDALVLVKTHI